MKLLVIGATGMAGQAIVEEAVKRGISVIANGRTESKLLELQSKFKDIEILPKNAFEINDKDFVDVDVIVDAFSTIPAKGYLHVDLAGHLIARFRENKDIRIAFILGAGSLFTGNTENRHLVLRDIENDESTLPWRATAQNQLKELNYLQDVDNVNWFGVSPGINFVPGETAQEILVGKDVLLTDKSGNSETTSGTMATAILDEIINPVHNKERFTVVNG